MPRAYDLPAGSTLTFPSGTRLRARGLAGTATQWSNSGTRLRGWKLPAEEDSSPQLLDAMEKLDITEQETIQMDVRPTAGAADDDVILEPAAPPAGSLQVVLYQDESGLLSWHIPENLPVIDTKDAAGSRTRAGGAAAVFKISARTKGARESLRNDPAGSRRRGPITVIGRKVFKVLILPLLSDWVGEAVQKLAVPLEGRYRRENIRPLTTENYRTAVTDEFTGWPGLRGQRALLVIHGIFSCTEGMLGGFPAPDMRALEEHYQGRMIALDQLTVSRSPVENAIGFLEKARDGIGPDHTVEFDILCHSRGGIVSRTLVEQGQQLVPGNRCSFRKVMFVGSPNQGSPLADPDHMVEMIDTFTNLATKLPDAWPAYSLELLLGLVKLIVHGGERHLPGAAAMSTLPGQYITDKLNAQESPLPASCDYAAIASDFEPRSDAGIPLRLANQLLDRVFRVGERAIGNDLIVPCGGVYEANKHPWFPIAKRFVFGPADGVMHTDYFSQPATIEAIKWHFELPGALPPPGMLYPEKPSRLRGGPRSAASRTRTRSFTSHLLSVDNDPPRGTTGDTRSFASSEASGTAAPSSAEAIRQPQLIYHEAITWGTPGPLEVALHEIMAGEDIAGALRVALTAGGTTKISVNLTAPGFDIAEPDGMQTLIVQERPDPNTEKVTFTVTPRDPGPVPVLRELRAVFWQGTQMLGSTSHWTAVLPKNWSGPLPEGNGKNEDTGVRISRLRRDCDWVLSVEGNDFEGVSPFKLSLRSAIPNESYESRRAGRYRPLSDKDSLEKYVADFFDSEFQNYPADNLSDTAFAAALPVWELNYIAALKDLGRTLWSWLPDEFRNEYLRLHTAGLLPASILIASEEMVLPWELVVPQDAAGNNLTPLGQAHVIGRWHPAWRRKPDPQRLRVQSGCLLAPAYTGRRKLRQAGVEMANILKLLPGLKSNPAMDLPTVRREVMEATDLQLLHFIGHGEFSVAQADESALVMANENLLKARTFNGSALAAKASPVLYLSACSVGQTGSSLGRAGGFCANFLRSGGTGVIAPYWPVYDVDAADFAKKLYGKLLNQRSVGEALRELRNEHPDKSTYQAFSWFGDPWATLDLDALI